MPIRRRLALALATALALTACGHAPVAAARAAGEVASLARGGSVTGDIRLIKQVPSTHVARPRDVWVYLPPGYDQAKDRYPVLYMHDGNNCFDASMAFGGNEWHADETAQRLIKAKQLPPMILVMVANTPDRLDEYTWVPGQHDGQTVGGKGAAYGEFLVTELKPLIDKTYRTQPDRAHTGVLGSSLGGLESFYLGRYHGETFGKLGVMSASIWWSDRKVLDEVAKLPTDLKIWLDMGGSEGSEPAVELENARELDRRLLARGYVQGQGLDYYEDLPGGHNEQAWAYRLPMALTFLFGR